MNNVADVQQHPQDLSRSLSIRNQARVASLLCTLCAAVLAQPALAGVNQWTPTGGPSGGVVSLVADPLTHSTLYASTVLGGMFKSIDSGATWSAINTGLTSLDSVKTLVVDHVAPATGPATVYASRGGAILKSVDSGASWKEVAQIMGSVEALVMDPVTHSTLYAGTLLGGGVFKSTNGGTSWSTVNTNLPTTVTSGVRALVVDPVTPATLYAAVQASSGGGVYKSINGGTNWSLANAGLTLASVVALAVDPVTPVTLYAGGGGGGSGSGVFKSTNGGVSWSAANTGLSGGVSTLVVDPITPATLYAVGGIVSRSVDGGASWGSLDYAGSVGRWFGCLVVDPVTPATLYVGEIFSFAGPGVYVGTFDATAASGTTSGAATSAGGGVIDPASLLLALLGSYSLARRRNTSGT